MPDYSRGKIYKLICHRSGLVYIGSTCEPTLAKRLASHVADYKQYSKGTKNFITSFKVLENGVYEIILIENFSCDNKDELHKRERFFIEERICVNKNLPCRTREEILEYMHEYTHEYNNKHKDYYKQYYINNKIKYTMYYANKKAKAKKLKKVEILLPPVILEKTIDN